MPEEGKSKTRRTRRRTKQHACSICKQEFVNADKLAEHQTEQHAGEFKCHICDATKSTEFNLERHIKGHTAIEQKKFVCNVCDKPHSTNYGLKQHQAVHIPAELKLTCPEPGCGSKFANVKHARRHAKEHHPTGEDSQPRPIRCLVQGCHKYLPSQRSIKDHSRNRHPGVDRKWCFDSTFKAHSANLDQLVIDVSDPTRRRTPPPSDD